jgi:hypothetical protein
VEALRSLTGELQSTREQRKCISTRLQIWSEANLSGIDQSVPVEDELVAEKFAKNPRFQSAKEKDLSGYVQTISIKPSTDIHVVPMFSPQQIRYGSLCDQLFIDSTGQMVKDWQNKKVFCTQLWESSPGKIR